MAKDKSILKIEQKTKAIIFLNISVPFKWFFITLK